MGEKSIQGIVLKTSDIERPSLQQFVKNENGDDGTGGNQGTSSSKKFFSYGFDIRCVRRFLRINKVLFPRVLSKTVGWLMSLVVFRYLLYLPLQN